ncbi:hypothetical protein MKX03_007801, partial [Papaver bracteatum]
KDKESLEKENFELKSKLEESCGVGVGGGSSDDEEPWMTGPTVLSNWVSLDSLEVFTAFQEDKHLLISKIMGIPKFGRDNTTNVQPNRFSIGIFPIVVMNVPELIPNKEWARFDPDVWSLYQNEGNYYAARSPFE